MTKRLIVYYSHTGNAERVSQELAPIITADVESIRPLRPYSGKMPLKGIFHVMGGKRPDIETESLDCGAYDTVVLLTPVWAGTVPPHVRTYLERNREKIGAVRLICVSRSSGDGGVRKALNGFGLEPQDVLLLHDSELADGSFKRKLEGFAAKI